jgi:hypothetical protein
MSCDLFARMALTSLASDVEEKLLITHLNFSESGGSTGKNLSTYGDENVIKLHLDTWHNNAFESPSETDVDKRSRFRYILEYFIKLATLNDLDDTPALTKLQDAFNQTMPVKGILKHVEVKDRTQSKMVALLISSTPEKTYRDFAFSKFPIFNIFDAIALIYTVCVGEIKVEQDAEFHLLQLKYILNSITSTGYIPKHACPSTVAASWKHSMGSSFRACFAFSCTGNKNQKILESTTRREYCDYLYSVRKTIFKDGIKNKNEAGNCPEALTWGAVCRDAGVYKSLCLSVPKDETFRCCTHCQGVAAGGKEQRHVDIVDLFQISSLVDQSILKQESKGGYEYCKLLPFKEIMKIKGSKGGKVQKKSSVEKSQKN